MKKLMHSPGHTNLCVLQIPKPQEMRVFYPQIFSLERCPHELILLVVPTQLFRVPPVPSKVSTLIGQEITWSRGTHKEANKPHTSGLFAALTHAGQ